MKATDQFLDLVRDIAGDQKKEYNLDLARARESRKVFMKKWSATLVNMLTERLREEFHLAPHSVVETDLLDTLTLALIDNPDPLRGPPSYIYVTVRIPGRTLPFGILVKTVGIMLEGDEHPFRFVYPFYNTADGLAPEAKSLAWAIDEASDEYSRLSYDYENGSKLSDRQMKLLRGES